MRSISLARPATDPSVRPRLTLALLSVQHALIHAQTALLPLVFIQVAVAFRIGPESIGLLLAVGSLSSGLIQLAFGPLTRVVPRRALRAAAVLSSAPP